jgi:hypothetical protein
VRMPETADPAVGRPDCGADGRGSLDQRPSQLVGPRRLLASEPDPQGRGAGRQCERSAGGGSLGE